MPANPPSASPVSTSSEFILCSCQPGAEAALKARVAAVIPGARPGAWRRGVVTFRIPNGAAMPVNRLVAELVFARVVIDSLGQVSGDDQGALVRDTLAVAIAKDVRPANVHVWNRVMSAGPGATQAVASTTHARRMILEALGLDASLPTEATPGERILDCVIDSETRWWVGWHTASTLSSRWPGGLHPAAHTELPEGIVSRAWLKLDEALRVFGVPLEAGERAIELGASPGGACQRLLEAGLHVVGVDPALVDPVVASRPRFSQWRMRARDVPLERFLGCDWLVSDMNIDPTSTLAAIARVAIARGVRLKGIIATLKLPEWSRTDELSVWLDTIRSWGYEPRARQLSTSGREVCVVAMPGGKTRPDTMHRRRNVTSVPPRRTKRRRAE